MRPETKGCDVLVVGAGVAGVAAAIAAARGGARTILVEKNDFLGGSAVVGMHRYVCGFYANGAETPSATLNEGIAREVSEHLTTREPGRGIVKMGRVYVLPFSPKDLCDVFELMLAAEDAVTLLRKNQVISVRRDGDKISQVTLRGSEGESVVRPGAVIDCSGEGAAIRLSGAACEIAPLEDRQLAGYSFHLGHLQGSNAMLNVQVPYWIAQAVKEKNWALYYRFATFTPSGREWEGVCQISVLPDEDLADVRGKAVMLHQYLSEKLPELRSSTIQEMGTSIVEREGLRMVGEYTLTEEDVLQARKFKGGVVKNAWPIEFWDREKGPCYQYLKPGDHYDIPLGCLCSRDVSNLFAAGRCISATSRALASTRVMGPCMSLGEASACAAVSYLRTGDSFQRRNK
ncbi:MAG: FAD-dependent oxidoreductase [Candidatus Omnitrophota bacterium]